MERLTVNNLNEVCYDPWELCGMDNYCTKDCHAEGGCTNGCNILKMYKKLAEYEDLEEKGLLLKLPCKVGDTIYIPYSKPKYIKSVEVQNFTYDGCNLHIITDFITLSEHDIDIYAFLTQEKAEKALNRRNNSV